MTMADPKPVPTSGMATEPAAIIGTITAIVTALIAFAVAFGINLSDDQQAAILGLVAALAPIVAALLTRRKVYSTASTQKIANRSAETRDATIPNPPAK